MSSVARHAWPASPGQPATSGPGWQPGYLALHESGELAERARAAMAALAECRLCPHDCGIDRLHDPRGLPHAGRRGICQAGVDPVVASWNVHRWEEPPISGTRGSGTVFFSLCAGRCCFCQNYPISQLGYGNVITPARLAEMLLELQGRGCHNINFVTPTHFVPQILTAVDLAAAQGLHIPLVYNSSGYEAIATLQLLAGVIDIWLPDAKYADEAVARRLSGFPAYVTRNQAALAEIFRQVGDELVVDDAGIARRGLIIRHLVLPENQSGTAEVMAWIARDLSPRVHVSLMDQYFPAYKVLDDPMLGRKITDAEYEAALEALDSAGLANGWVQEHDPEAAF